MLPSLPLLLLPNVGQLAGGDWEGGDGVVLVLLLLVLRDDRQCVDGGQQSVVILSTPTSHRHHQVITHTQIIHNIVSVIRQHEQAITNACQTSTWSAAMLKTANMFRAKIAT
jgi:hypothetical protein